MSVTGVCAVSETVLFGVGEYCGAMSSEAEGAGWVRAVFTQFPSRCGRQPRQGCPLLTHKQFTVDKTQRYSFLSMSATLSSPYEGCLCFSIAHGFPKARFFHVASRTVNY